MAEIAGSIAEFGFVIPVLAGDEVIVARQPVVAVRRRRHNWRHANPAACRDNTRPVFGSADSAGGRAFGCSKKQGRTGQPGFAAAPFLAQGPGRSIEAVG